MTERENALLVYHHQKPEWTPNYFEAVYVCGFWSNNECGLRGERVSEDVALDVFGVEWNMSHGSPVPVPQKYLLEDICDWREKVVFPEPDTWDWEMMARTELKDYDGTKVLTYFCEQGCFDRLTQLMGFENALISLVMEPEECAAFFERVADYKIKVIENVAKYYHPDVFCYTDDLAKADSLFMSPSTYRELIKPAHARIIQAIRDNGMIAEQHTCGKCEAIMDDYVEMGIESFFPAQASNDLAAIQKKHGSRLVITGGYDSQGPAGQVGASEETLKKEARRMAESYAVNGGYICMPMIGDAMRVDEEEARGRMIVGQEFRRVCREMGI